MVEVVRVAAALVAVLCAALPAGNAGAATESSAPIVPPLSAKLDAIVAGGTVDARGDAPAVSVAIVQNGRLVYAHASGLEDVAAKRAATTRTRFRIASITKTFTAVAVMQLVEAGKVKLDEHLATYLPGAPHAREVTVRQLLMHTSGIPNFADAAFNDGSVRTPTTKAAIVAAAGQKPLAFAPGTRYAYSNTGYVLLGLLVEKVAGTSLAAYENDRIFAPAGMRDTTVGEPAPKSGTATGYMDSKGTPAQPYDASWTYAAGDIVSTPSDLARFDIAMMNGALVLPQTFAIMQANPIATDEEDAKYGLGLTLFPLADLTFVGHHGGVPGFESDNEMLPDQKFAVIVCGNSFAFSTAKLNAPLLAVLFPATSVRAVAERKQMALIPAQGEDSAATERFRAFFVALQKGRIDRTTVTSELNAQLDAEALGSVAERLAALGTLDKLVYRSKVEQGLGTVFRYTGVFSKQTTPMTFSLDKAGKIAGVFLQ
jgi:CubicO group peptidase (beta-lactamase class C family)